MGELAGLSTLTPYGALLGVCVFVVLSVVRGWFIPVRTHERELASANKRGDEWKETALTTRDQNKVLMDQNSELIQANRTAATFMGTVNKETGGDRHVAQP